MAMADDAAIMAEIERRLGMVTPDAVLEEATDPTHPWHSRFEWDDSIAAHKFRLVQARTLIRSITFVRTETETRKIPWYVHDSDLPQGQQGYVSVFKIQSDEERIISLMRAEFGRVAAILHRALGLTEVLGTLDKIGLLPEVKQAAAMFDDLLTRIDEES